jgi:hypothetical protein
LLPDGRLRARQDRLVRRAAERSQVWFGGLDEKERTEKILGQEYVTILLNEISQIPYASRNLAITRLAQKCTYKVNGVERLMRLLELADCNPPSKAHWATSSSGRSGTRTRSSRCNTRSSTPRCR